MEAMKEQATPVSYGMKTIDKFLGRQVGLSDWIVVDQRRIDEFADCTGDRQWIHVDAERASRESPYGGTIAHGYLTLSLAASLTIGRPRSITGSTRRVSSHRYAQVHACAIALSCRQSRIAVTVASC